MPGRMNEFALGATYKTGDNGLNNAVTETGNDVDSHVEDAVSENEDWRHPHPGALQY